MEVTEVLLLKSIRNTWLRSSIIMILGSSGCRGISGSEVYRQIKEYNGITYGLSEERVRRILRELWSEGVIEKIPANTRGNNYKWITSDCLQDEKTAYKLGLEG